MRTYFTTSSLAVATILVALSAPLSPAFAQNYHSMATSAERDWLPAIPKIHARLVAVGYRDIEKFERNRNEYEVKAIDPRGERVKLFLNRFTGIILESLPDVANAKRNFADKSGQLARNGCQYSVRSSS